MSFSFIKTPNTAGMYNRDHESIEVETTDSDATISELCELFKRFLLACGYNPHTVNTYFGEEELK